jgi:hypothetical protein
MQNLLKSPLQVKAEQLRQEDLYTQPPAQPEEYKLPVERREKEPLRAFLERQTREQIERILKMPFRELPTNLQPKNVSLIEKKEKAVRFNQNPISPSQNDNATAENTTPKEEAKKSRDLQKSANRLKYLTASGKLREPKINEGKFEFNAYNPSKNLKQEIAQMTVRVRAKQELLLTLANKLGDGRRKCEAVKDFIISYKSNGVDVGVLEEYTDDLMKLNDQLQQITLTQDEGTNADIYEQLEDLVNQMNVELDEAKIYYENQMTKLLKLQSEPLEKTISDLNKKNADLMQQCNMLEENLSSRKPKGIFSPTAKTPSVPQTEPKKDSEMIIMLQQRDLEIEKLKKQLMEANLQKDNQIKQLKKEIQDSAKKGEANVSNVNEVAHLKADIEKMGQEISKKNEKINQLKEEFEKKDQSGEDIEKMKEELQNLMKELELKQKENDQMRADYEKIMSDKDELRNRQKNEWAEIYANLKQEIEDLKNDISLLNNENDKLMKQLELTHQSMVNRK